MTGQPNQVERARLVGDVRRDASRHEIATEIGTSTCMQCARPVYRYGDWRARVWPVLRPGHAGEGEA